MMCGKSTYGCAAAKALGWDFIDLDDHIVPGTAPGEIIRTQGEEAFRQLETEALARVLARQGDCILALGGGTVMRERNPVYESVADYTLDTSGLAPETIVDTLATVARSF